jgi:hypothetical protein
VIPALPGTLADLLTVGMVVYQDSSALHTEVDPDLWRVRGGVAHSIGDGMVGTAQINRHAPGGVALDVLDIDTIHDCGDGCCPHNPRMAKASEVRWVARRLLRLVAQGHGPLDDTDRRHVAIAVALLTKGIL